MPKRLATSGIRQPNPPPPPPKPKPPRPVSSVKLVLSRSSPNRIAFSSWPASNAQKSGTMTIRRLLVQLAIARPVRHFAAAQQILVRCNMPDSVPIRPAFAEARHLPNRLALGLPGGGALGACRAGAYEVLAKANVPINCIAGVSIGAVNGAIIAGNPPHERVSKLLRLLEVLSSASA